MLKGIVGLKVYEQTDLDKLNNEYLVSEKTVKNTTQTDYLEKIAEAMWNENYDFDGSSDTSSTAVLKYPAIRLVDMWIHSENTGGAEGENYSVDLNVNASGNTTQQGVGFSCRLKGTTTSGDEGFSFMKASSAVSSVITGTNKLKMEFVIGGTSQDVTWIEAVLGHFTFFTAKDGGSTDTASNVAMVNTSSTPAFNQTITQYQTLKLTWTLQYGPDL